MFVCSNLKVTMASNSYANHTLMSSCMSTSTKGNYINQLGSKSNADKTCIFSTATDCGRTQGTTVSVSVILCRRVAVSKDQSELKFSHMILN